MKNEILSRKKEKWWVVIVLVLAILQLLLIFVSWLTNAAALGVSVRSLLGSEGVRWIFGTFVTNLQYPLLVWLILIIIAYGVVDASGLLMAKYSLYRQRLALNFVFIEIALFIIVAFLLVAIPHAVLLSITGAIFPSSFSKSIIPFVSLISIICSFTYGFISGTFKSFNDIYYALTNGLTHFSFLFPLYILGTQLYFSILFVFFET